MDGCVGCEDIPQTTNGLLRASLRSAPDQRRQRRLVRDDKALRSSAPTETHSTIRAETYDCHVGFWQRRFLQKLFEAVRALRSRVNFTNLVRFSPLYE
jgi:hypothetical protein